MLPFPWEKLFADWAHIQPIAKQFINVFRFWWILLPLQAIKVCANEWLFSNFSLFVESWSHLFNLSLVMVTSKGGLHYRQLHDFWSQKQIDLKLQEEK